MTSRSKDEIREAVRERYGQIAKTLEVSSESKTSTSCCGPAENRSEPLPMTSCCGSPDAASEVESSASSCCGPKEFPIEKMADFMGYSKEDLENVPEGSNMGLGCGNPVALASLKQGETVVDLGSGGGFDCFLAAKEVGDTGKVIGVDMTPDMVSKARRNVETAKLNNVEFRLGEIEHLPIADSSADIIMSNCVINLSPDKKSVYLDAHRVLKPGGRLAISDVVATAPLPDEISNDLALLGACIGGAATIDATKRMLEEVGFKDIKIISNDKSRELIREWDPARSQKAADYVVSAYIEGIKPSE